MYCSQRRNVLLRNSVVFCVANRDCRARVGRLAREAPRARGRRRRRDDEDDDEDDEDDDEGDDEDDARCVVLK